MRDKITQEIAILTWVRSALKDFSFGFHIEEVFTWDSIFFYCQGLEKLCKAYIIGMNASEYENLPAEKARSKIHDIAIRYRHNISKMVKQLIKWDVVTENILKKEYATYGTHKITGVILIEILEEAYEESRYPVPNPVHRKFKLPKGGWIEPLECSEPREFAMEIGRKIIQKIEQNFNINNAREKPLGTINDSDWRRFKRVFFQDK